MKLKPLNLTHRLTSLGDTNVDVPVYFYSNRLEGDIMLNGLESVQFVNVEGKDRIIFNMNYLDFTISFLKRHTKILTPWIEEHHKVDLLPTYKKDIFLQGLFEKITCYNSFVSSLEMSKSQEILHIHCDRLVFDVEQQVLSRSVRQKLETVWR